MRRLRGRRGAHDGDVRGSAAAPELILHYNQLSFPRSKSYHSAQGGGRHELYTWRGVSSVKQNNVKGVLHEMSNYHSSSAREVNLALHWLLCLFLSSLMALMIMV